MLVSSERSSNGKLFVEFLATIILNYLKKRTQETQLFQKFIMRELPDNIDLIECFGQRGHRTRFSEITEEQGDIYRKLGVPPLLLL
jgi:hypothetical protein